MIDIFTWRDAFGVTIQTPNIDRLMAQGVRFANAYATVPLCAPCRAEMATGLSPFRTGLVDLNRFWRDIMPPERAWAYDLRAAGFYNFTTGKVDSNYKPMPEEYRRMLFHEEPAASDRRNRRGEHHYLGGKGPGIFGVNHPNDDGSQDDKFYDYWVAQNAIDHLRRADPNRRHLIQLGFKHPHMNLDCPDRFYQMYDVTAIRWPESASMEDFFGPQPGFPVYDSAYIANGNFTPEKAGDEGWRQVVRAYFAACSHVDHEIGRFLTALEQSPFGDRTTVIFLSDNGFNLGTHDSFHKMSQWDSAAHVPLGIWSKRMAQTDSGPAQGGKVVELPVSLHNLPSTIMELAGLPRRADWVSGQSLLPLIDPAFGEYDRSKSPVTAVFGTLSVRPADPGLSQYRYFRYPNGEEHVYDLIADPGETTNLIDTAPIAALREELRRNASELGLEIGGADAPAAAPMGVAETEGAPTAAGQGAQFWAYGDQANRLRAEASAPDQTLWYLGAPDDHVLEMPADVETLRIGTVVARSEAPGPRRGKAYQVVAHPETALRFESSERVAVSVSGSQRNDEMVGPKFGSTVFYGREGDDVLRAIGKRRKERAQLYGGSGNDTLIGGPGDDILDGGSGDDVIYGRTGANLIIAGPGNDVIEDGDDGSTIHTGPGRNRISMGKGNHLVYVGPGPNRIKAAAGPKRFVLDYGAAVELSGWTEEQIYDLSRWPGRPSLRRMERGAMLWHGPSCLWLTDLPEGCDPLDQCLIAANDVSGWERSPPEPDADVQRPEAKAQPGSAKDMRSAAEDDDED